MPDQETEYKPKTIHLWDLPKDVYLDLLFVQAYEKEKCGCQKSQQTVINNLIRKDAKRIREQKPSS